MAVNTVFLLPRWSRIYPRNSGCGALGARGFKWLRPDGPQDIEAGEERRDKLGGNRAIFSSMTQLTHDNGNDSSRVFDLDQISLLPERDNFVGLVNSLKFSLNTFFAEALRCSGAIRKQFLSARS